MSLDSQISDFLAGGTFAVVGASSDRAKYGNKVLRCYLQHSLTAWPVNPNESIIEGLDAYADLASLPGPVHGASIITQPAVTEKIVEHAAETGITRLGMQPGAESDKAVALAESLGLSVISGGPCILVTLGYSDQ